MRYSVVDFLVSSLFRWIFSEKHPLENAEYSPGAFVRLLMNAAQAKDYVETISGIDQGLPNADTLFWRLSECASRDLILRDYKKVVKRHIEAAKGRKRRRRFIIAIDETHEPFYGRIKNLWIHDYRNGVKGATGSYKYIVVSIVSGNLRFILLVIPIPKISNDTDYYVRELLIFECMLYNVWQFFKGRVPFRRFVNTLFRRHITKTAVLAVIGLLKEKDILDDKDPPPDKIYEELIEKFGYIGGVIWHPGC